MNSPALNRIVAAFILVLSFALGASPAEAQLPPPPGPLGKLNDPNPEVRVQAARELSAQGPLAAPAVPALAERLSDESPLVRAYAAHALGRIGPAASPTFPQLAKLVTDADPQVRREAVKALRSLKVEAALLMPAMVKVLESSSSAEVVPAMSAIAEVGKDAVPPLVVALDHEEARYWASQILGMIGPDAADAAPAVAKILNDPRAEVRREAVLCIGHMGKGSPGDRAGRAGADRRRRCRHSSRRRVGRRDDRSAGRRSAAEVDGAWPPTPTRWCRSSPPGPPPKSLRPTQRRDARPSTRRPPH